jgi:hypothetical protein
MILGSPPTWPSDSPPTRRDVRPVKAQQRTSGGCWRALEGRADFAIVQSYPLSTAAKWGVDHLDALTQLFTTCSPPAHGDSRHPTRLNGYRQVPSSLPRSTSVFTDTRYLAPPAS